MIIRVTNKSTKMSTEHTAKRCAVQIHAKSWSNEFATNVAPKKVIRAMKCCGFPRFVPWVCLRLGWIRQHSCGSSRRLVASSREKSKKNRCISKLKSTNFSGTSVLDSKHKQFTSNLSKRRGTVLWSRDFQTNQSINKSNNSINQSINQSSNQETKKQTSHK